MAKIAFVNDKDEVIGAGTKDEAWTHGYIFRSVKVFIFNKNGELLLQKRAPHLNILISKLHMRILSSQRGFGKQFVIRQGFAIEYEL